MDLSSGSCQTSVKLLLPIEPLQSESVIRENADKAIR